jgi:hypothetical protein
VGLVPAVSLLCYGSTESDPVAYVVSPFKRRDGTIPLLIPLRPIRSPFERMTWLIVFFFDTSQAGSVLTSRLVNKAEGK